MAPTGALLEITVMTAVLAVGVVRSAENEELIVEDEVKRVEESELDDVVEVESAVGEVELPEGFEVDEATAEEGPPVTEKAEDCIAFNAYAPTRFTAGHPPLQGFISQHPMKGGSDPVQVQN